MGVMLIVRPGMAGFEPASLWAVMGVLGPGHPRPGHPCGLGPDIRVPDVGLGVWPHGADRPCHDVGHGQRRGGPERRATSALLGLRLLVGVFAYYMVVAAMRVGEIPVVTPFRYTRMVFALVVALTVFGERPDA